MDLPKKSCDKGDFSKEEEALASVQDDVRSQLEVVRSVSQALERADATLHSVMQHLRAARRRQEDERRDAWDAIKAERARTEAESERLAVQRDELADQRDELTRQQDELARQQEELARQRDELARQEALRPKSRAKKEDGAKHSKRGCSNSDVSRGQPGQHGADRDDVKEECDTAQRSRSGSLRVAEPGSLRRKSRSGNEEDPDNNGSHERSDSQDVPCQPRSRSRSRHRKPHEGGNRDSDPLCLDSTRQRDDCKHRDDHVKKEKSSDAHRGDHEKKDHDELRRTQDTGKKDSRLTSFSFPGPRAPRSGGGRGDAGLCFLYIIDKCTKGDACKDRHPDSREVKLMRGKMGRTQCRYGMDCSRVDCAYGHPPGHPRSGSGQVVLVAK